MTEGDAACELQDNGGAKGDPWGSTPWPQGAQHEGWERTLTFQGEQPSETATWVSREGLGENRGEKRERLPQTAVNYF